MFIKLLKSLLVIMACLVTFTPTIASANVLGVTTSVYWLSRDMVTVKGVIRNNGPADVYATLKSIDYSCEITSKGRTVYKTSKSETDLQVLRSGDSVVRFHVFNFKLPGTGTDYFANGHVNVNYSYTTWKNK